MTDTLKNVFGLPLYEVKEVLQDGQVEDVVQSMRCEVFKYLGVSEERSNVVNQECLSLAQNYSDVSQYEKSAFESLKREGVVQAIPNKLSERVEKIYQQVGPHLLEGSILDLGCGDAGLAQILNQYGFEIQLADVYKHPNLEKMDLPFKKLIQGGPVPFNDNEFNNVLLLTVLHHSDDPNHVISEAYRTCKPNGRVIVIESVYGVNGIHLSDQEKRNAGKFLELNEERQRLVNIFFDHFYNCVIQYSEDKSIELNVPYNFNTPNNWKDLFEAVGFSQENVIHLGADQPAVPEYHTLHILKALK